MSIHSTPRPHSGAIATDTGEVAQGGRLPPPAGTDRNVLLIALFVALAAGVVYALTLTPGIGLVDSGELALAAWLPGNAHPPGTPLYVLLGWLFTRLPLGAVAVRLNILSAVCGAVAAALIAAAAWLSRPARGEPAWRAYLPPLAAGLAFAFSTSLWTYAVVAEVYTLHLALLAGIVVALFAWRRAPGALGERSNRWLYVAAFLAGLAFTVHNASVLTLVPAILFLVIGRDWDVLRGRGRGAGSRGRRAEPRAGQAGSKGRGAGSRRQGAEEVQPGAPRQHSASGRIAGRQVGLRAGRVAFLRVAAIAAGCVAAGLLAYAYLPLRAVGQPLLNWGDPRTPLTFWWHVTGKWYQLFFETAETPVPVRIVRFLELLAQQQFYFGLLAAALGLWSLWRRDRALAVFLLLIVAGNLVLFAWYDTYQDQQAYVYPALLALGLLIGEAARLTPHPLFPSPRSRSGALGAEGGPETGAGRGGRIAGWLPACIALAVPLVALAGNYAANDHSRDWLAEDYARNILRGIEPGGVLLSSDWDATISPLMYVQHVLGERPDVTVVDVNLMRRSWYADYVRQADPAFYAAVAPQYDAFLRDLRAWEIDECNVPPCAAEIQPNFEALIDAMVSQAAAAGRPAYLTRDVDRSVTRDPQRTWMVVSPNMTRVPQGLAYRLYADDAFHPTPAPVLELRGLADGTVPYPPNSFALEVPGRYIDMLTVRAHYLQGGGDAAGAVEVFRQLLRVDPGNAEALAAVGQ